MDLRRYVENIQQQLAAAAESGGEDARALAGRLVAPLDAAIQLTLQDALAAAAEEITCELAPGSVELRLRGRDLEFVVTSPPGESAGGDLTEGADDKSRDGWPASGLAPQGDDGAMSRINLRMPDQLKARIEQAAAGEGISVNSWVVRAAGAALDRTDPDRQRQRRAPQGAQRYSGWVR